MVGPQTVNDSALHSAVPAHTSHRGLIVLLCAFTALAITYSVAVPLFEGPDEDDHFRYVKYLADHHALPVQLFQPGGGEAGHQGWQPPLYYALAALVISPVNTSDFEQHLWRNPASSFQGDPACCGRNLYFHTRAEDFPYTGTTLAVHLARGVSILFGVLTVAGIYALMLTLLPAQDGLALAAAAVVGFNPTFLFASALVSNDIPLAALCTLALLLCAQLLLNRRAPNLRDFTLLGIAIALAVLVKSTALALIPLALAVGAFVAWRQQDARVGLHAALGLLAPNIILTGWWFVRNQILYGDPLAYRLLYASAIFPRDHPLTFAELFQINLPWMWQTFWGGPTPGDFSTALLVVLALLSALAAFGSLLFFLRTTHYALRITLLLLAVWLGFILVAQIQFIRISGGTDQGRYLFPAISSFAVLFVLGLWQMLRHVSVWAGQHVKWRVSPMLTHSLAPILFVALALYVLFAHTLPAYARPPQMDASVLDHADQKLNVNFSDELALRGYALSTRVLAPGATLDVNLYWRGLKAMRVSYRVFVHLVSKDGRVAGGKDVIPFHGAYATVLWQPGQWVPDTVSVPVARDAVPGDYQLEIGLYPMGHPDDRLNLANSDDDHVLLDSIQVK
jgi:Dolichyl-phosphate-mannose-protein mannosyltransferase